jgi:enterochelin esterase-like enzyme
VIAPLQWPQVQGRRHVALLAGLVALALATAADGAVAVYSRPLHGTVSYGGFFSHSLDGIDHYSVYLPTGYATSGRRYPVVYFLHGLPAAPTAYRSIATITDAVEQSGREAIVVGVEGARAGDDDPEWRDWGPGRDWETATAVELVRVIDDRYRSIPTREARALIGISAGGYGATLIASHHPDTYAVVESWSGYFHATNPAGTATLDLGSLAADQWGDFSRQVPLLRKRFGKWLATTYFRFYVGTDDVRFVDENKAIAAELRRYGIPHVYFRLYAGAHTWSLWREHAEVWVARALALATSPR